VRQCSAESHGTLGAVVERVLLPYILGWSWRSPGEASWWTRWCQNHPADRQASPYSSLCVVRFCPVTSPYRADLPGSSLVLYLGGLESSTAPSPSPSPRWRQSYSFSSMLSCNLNHRKDRSDQAHPGNTGDRVGVYLNIATCRTETTCTCVQSLLQQHHVGNLFQPNHRSINRLCHPSTSATLLAATHHLDFHTQLSL